LIQNSNKGDVVLSTATVAWSCILLALGIVVVLVSVLSKRSPVERLSRTVGLQPPEPPLLDAVERRGRRLLRWRAVGIAVGIVVSVGATIIAVLADAIPDPGTLLAWIGLTGMLLGAGMASLLAVLTDPTVAEPGAPRVAHPRAIRLRDYLDPLELDGARIIVVLGALAAIATMAWPAPAATDSLQLVAPISAVGGVIALALAEIGGRRVVLARPRTADSPAALAWDDALRSNDLRTLYTAPIMLGLYATIFGFPAVAIPLLDLLPQTWALVLANTGFYIAIAALIVVVIVALRRQPGRYYLKRLWPELLPAAAR
jgi:hypothetical protein